MKLTLHTEGWYDAAHHLDNYDGACKNLHGHTYKVEVWVKGKSTDLDEAGIMWDFGKLKKILKDFDHCDLNDYMKTSKDEFTDCNSTAENLSMIVYNILSNTDDHLKFKVRLYEQIAPKESYCEYGDW